jgi:DNA-binding NtrC family response regulator
VKVFTILVVDDEQWVRLALGKLLESDGYAVDRVSSGKEAMECLRTTVYDMIITDLKLTDVDGIEVLKAAKSQPYDPAVLLVTAHGTVETAVEAIKLGAFDYLTKPLDSNRVLLTVKQAIETRGLRVELSNLKRSIGDTYGSRQIVYASDKMKRVMELVGIVSKSDSTILIEGESGTGKELVARAIHQDGPRANEPFVAVNCAALPEALLESELFGHVRGAFTGAHRDKRGLFEEANGGTLLLDEIGDLPLETQVKLLRVLQDGEIRRVGSTSVRRVDVRIIAATNADIGARLASGRFREDLYYRLSVIPIRLPPLRERIEDVIPLSSHFLKPANARLNRNVQRFSPTALTTLMQHDWPGNVRELQNLVERTVALSRTEIIGRGDAAAGLGLAGWTGNDSSDQPSEQHDASLTDAYRVMEREQIIAVLEAQSWHRSRAASVLGMSRTSLWRKMRAYRIEPESEM